MRHFFSRPLAMLLLLSLGFHAHGQFGPTPVNVAEAQMKSLAPMVSISGSVVSPNDSEVSARVDGQLTYVADVGQYVQAGERLARIEDQALAFRRHEQQARLEAAKRRLQFLDSEVLRLSSLATNNLSSQTELDRTTSDRDQAKASVNEFKAQLELIELNQAYLDVKAPFEGVVMARLAQVGELVAAGTAVVRLVETVNLEISAPIPLTAYQFAVPGSKIQFTSPVGSGSATIRAVVNVADDRSRSMELRASLSEGNWPVGLDVKVQVPTGLTQEVLAVPRDALVLRREGPRVFKVNNDNKAEQIVVTTGLASGEWIQITGAVQTGDRIVIRGAERLQPGQEVAVKSNNDTLVSL